MRERERIGERLVELRKAKGYSMRQLADMSGVSFANIYKIEHGRYNVSIDILSKICESLGCKIDLIEEEQ